METKNKIDLKDINFNTVIDDLDVVQELLTLLIADNEDFDSAWLDVIKDVAERYDRSLSVVKKLIEAL